MICSKYNRKELFRCMSTLLLLLFIPSACSGVFPFESASFEEYDYTILDPHSGSGAPYGGFSRATRSRLAKLPLFVPDLKNEDSPQKKDDFYMQVTDNQGQPYVCRLYHEDELLPESLEESMFVPPKFNSHQLSPSTTHEENAGTAASRMLPQYEGETSVVAPSKTTLKDKPMLLTEDEMKRLTHDEKIVSVQVLLSELEGICGQRHSGDWWSYEWCFEATVSQFHVRVQQKRFASQVSVEAVSSLGKFHSRTTLVDNLEESPNKMLDGGRRELARVIDEYKDGEICDETGERRKSYVHLMCCGKKYLDKGKGMLHRNGEIIVDTPLAALTHIVENPTCSYNVTVCTALLCVEEDTPGASVELFQNNNMEEGQSLAPRSGPKSARSPMFPSGSVRDILDKALGHKCLQSDTGGWWSFEFCHTRRVRQYHEEIVSEKTTAGAIIISKTLDSEHILGLYNPQLGGAYPDEDWKFVHNVTDSSTAMKSTSNAKGNGAYFEIEYTGGDVCDHTDVTDAAVIAGSAGAGGVVERSSSVRYSCGSVQSISVNEDSTCHYVVHVKVPELCSHPLFMAPVAKKQIVKCLPVL